MLLSRTRKRSVFIRSVARQLREENNNDIQGSADYKGLRYVDRKEIKEEVISTVT